MNTTITRDDKSKDKLHTNDATVTTEINTEIKPVVSILLSYIEKSVNSDMDSNSIMNFLYKLIIYDQFVYLLILDMCIAGHCNEYISEITANHYKKIIKDKWSLETGIAILLCLSVKQNDESLMKYKEMYTNLYRFLMECVIDRVRNVN